MKDLIDILLEIIMYIVTGYVLSKTFHFAALKQHSDNIEHILTGSLVLGFIYCKIANMIPVTISYEIDNILIILSALCLGYLSARLLRLKKIAYILDFLKIYDTGNKYLWDDLLDNKYSLKVCVTYSDKIYEGILYLYESYSNSPHIVLGAYTIKDIHNNIISDYSENNTKVIILKTDTAQFTEITYYIHSEECDDLNRVCNSYKKFKEQET